MKTKNRRNSARLHTGLMLTALLLVAVLVNIYENLAIGVTHYTLANAKLPVDFEGFRVVQLSDIHMITSPSEAQIIYQKTLKQHPDIIALTGDLVDTSGYNNEEYRTMTVDFCCELCTIAPVYYVYGNHEIMLLDDPENNTFKCQLESVGVQIFNNSHTTITKDGVKLELLGLQDPATLYKDPVYADSNKVTDILEDITAGIDEQNVSILLAHRPEHFLEYAEYNIDLALSGHAHGGQFRIPFTNIGLYAPSQGFFPTYSDGIYEEGASQMVVSRGIGNSKIPVRIFNMPEIVVVDVK